MSTTGLPLFDTTVQETNLWLKAVMKHLDTDGRHAAYLTFRATFNALRDRLGTGNAVHRAAQLPTLLRGLYGEGWRLAASQTKEWTASEFLKHVRRELPKGSSMDPNLAAPAVFAVMWAKLDVGEVGKVMGLMPSEFQDVRAPGFVALTPVALTPGRLTPSFGAAPC